MKTIVCIFSKFKNKHVLPHVFGGMVEKWLDQKVLGLMKQAAKPDDDVSEVPPRDIQIIPQSQPSVKEYNSVKLDVVLPISNEIEQIEYVPPDIPNESKASNQNVKPQFKEMKPSFNIFELVTPICIPAVPNK